MGRTSVRAPQGLIKFFAAAPNFREIQRWFIDVDKVTFHKSQTVVISAAAEITPDAETDEIWCDTDLNDVQVNLPAGPQGKRYRIVNVGSAGNRALLVPKAGVKLLGSTDSEYLSDSEALIITYQAPKDWY